MHYSRSLYLLAISCLLIAPAWESSLAQTEPAAPAASAGAALAPSAESELAIEAVGETLLETPAESEATSNTTPPSEEAAAAELAANSSAAVPEAAATEEGRVADPLAGIDDSSTEMTQQLDAEGIRLAMSGLDGESELEEAQRLELQAKYDQALAKIENAAAQEAICQGYTTAIEEAPAKLAELQARLAESEASAAPAALPEDLAALEQLKTTLSADAIAAQTKVDERTNERNARAERPADIAAARDAKKKRLAAITEELALLQDTSPTVRAQRTLLLAEQREARAIDRALELELQKITATQPNQAASLALAERHLAAINQQLERVTKEIAARRTAEAERQAREARRMAASAHPVLRELADLNVELTERNVELQALIKQNVTQVQVSRTQQTRLGLNYQRLYDRIEHTDRSETIGRLLHEYREQLPELSVLQREVRERKRALDSVSLSRIELQDELTFWKQESDSPSRVLASLPLNNEQERAEMLVMIGTILGNRETNAQTLIDSYIALEESLLELQTAETALIDETIRFQDYIAKNSLWVADLKPLSTEDASIVARGAGQVLSPANWGTLGELILTDIMRRPLYWLGMLAGLGALLPWAARLRRKLLLLGRRMEAGLFETSFVVTLKGILLTATISAPWPLLLMFLGWRIRAAGSNEPWAVAVGIGLMGTGVIYFFLEFLRHVCRPGGLAEAHFDWPSAELVQIRHRLGWPMTFGLPLVLIVLATVSAGYEPESAALGRVAFLLCTAVLAAWLPLLAMPAGSVVAAAFGHAQAVWRRRWQAMLCAASVVAPVTLAVLACLGYYYTSVQLGWRLAATAAVAVGMLLVHAVLVRALFVARRQRANEEASEAQVDTTTSRSGSRPRFAMLDPAASRIEVRQVVRKLTIISGLAAAWATWSHVLPALQFLETKQLVIGTTSISVWSLILASMLAVLAVLASKNLPELLEVTVLQRLPLDAGGRYALATLIRYAVTGIGIWWVFHVLQFQWQSVQWLFAAMSVGLGFGLQEVVANFVCGLIILFERPIRVGDIVTVGDMQGKVARIRIRATTILDWDHRELLVPNKEFITNRLVNWTLSDPITRVVIPVGIAYGSDTALARKLLLKVAKESPLVMTEPGPSAIFLNFGDSALNFELRVFLPDRNFWADLIDNLHSRIDEEFRAAGIEIAFPQCDVHVRSLDGVLRTRELAPGRPMEAIGTEQEHEAGEVEAPSQSRKDAA